MDGELTGDISKKNVLINKTNTNEIPMALTSLYVYSNM